jgi:hypothetical protein
MVSKGKVTLEDLNIVAEALPGTLDAVANSMGITKAQLLDMIHSGNALASDILPKLGDYFHKTFGKAAEEAAKKGQGAINNFTNAVTLAKLEMGNLVLPGVTEGLNLIADNFDSIAVAVEVLAAAGAAVVIGRIGEASVVAAAQQIQFVRAVLSGNAVLLDSRSVAKAKALAELDAARAVEAHKIALLDKARAEVIAANATRDAFMITVRKAQADQALAVAQAELAFQSSVTMLAQNRYAAAAGAATLASRAAAGAASLLTGAMNMMGGPIGMVVIALGALVWSLKSIDREVKEQYAKRKQEQDKAEADARQGVADAKAREDRLVEILGDSTQKQINELKRKTQEKLAQQNQDEKADVDALQKAGFNFDRYLEILARHRKAREKIIQDGQKAEKELYAKESLANLEDRKKQLKVDEDYFAAVGNLREKDRAALDQQYVEALKQVETYYAAQKAKAEESGASLAAIEEQRQKAVFQVQQLYAVKRGLLGEEEKKRALEVATSEGNERIALIRQQIADRVRTEIDGEKEITEIQADLAAREYEIAQRTFEQISAVYSRDSKEYIDAQKAKEQAFAKLTSAENAMAQKAEEERKQQREKSSLDYEMELKKRFDWLKDSEEQGTITCRQAAEDRLQAEVTYLSQIADLRARTVRDTTPDTVEYKQALAARYDADRAYKEKKDELDRMRMASFHKQLEEQRTAEWKQMRESLDRKSQLTIEWEKSLGETRAFAEGFYAQWDRITNSVISLGPAVAAAFGYARAASLDTLEGLRLKLTEVSKAIQQANEASHDFGIFSRLLGEHAEQAEKLRYEYYSQKLAVLELTESLRAMGLSTEYQIEFARKLVGQMNLLNDSDLSAVRTEIDRLTNAMKEAEEQARGTVNSLRDELDEMKGNKEAIENRDYEQKRSELQKKLEDAKLAGNLQIGQEYQNALALLDEIHLRKLATIREEAEAARQADEERHIQELKRIEDEKKARESALKSGSAFNLPSAIAMATGGRLPGPDSPVDNIWVKARTGEWFVRNESARYWGDAFMYGVNDPMSAMGRAIRDRMAGVFHTITAPILTPKVSFESGGPVSELPRGGNSYTFNLYTTNPVDKRLVRREIIPEIERRERKKK